MQIERRKRNARALCALVVSATLANTASAQLTYIAGYEPRSNVVQHSQVDLDIRDIISSFPKWKGGDSIYNGGLLNDCTTVAGACNWNGTSSLYPTLWDGTCTHTCPAADSANPGQKCTLSAADACLSTYGIYKYGKGSFKGNNKDDAASMRTLRGFATKLGDKGASARVAAKNNPFINKMNKYWAKQGLNELTWGQDIIEAAFKGTCVKNGNSCVKSGGVNLLDFGTVGNDFRVEVIKKGIIYLNIFPYVIWEFQDAINDCHGGDLGANDEIPGGGSVHAWDEAVAFYTGSLEGILKGGNNGLASCDDGNCELQFQLSDYRCTNFGTCTADADGDPWSGYSKNNEEIFKLFQQGEGEITEAAASSNTAATKCDLPDRTHEKAVTKMLVPFVQGCMRYLWKTKDSQKAKEAGELFAFASAALPFIDAVDPVAATKLFTRAWKLDFTTYTYEETKQGIEGTLSRLGAGEGIGTISCADIGDLVDSSDQLLAAGCTDPSSPSSSNNDTTLGLGIGIPLGAIAITALVFVVLLWRKSSANSKRVEELTMQLRGPGKDFYP
ncbi:predicted protein [Ostreococcus lucimarinus CCE9901]|uniref:Uncharacterized protein n=1 Tax=Ostreococcus lucimarinus (strain CCE9901) TaxID=436017 RepID=A4S4V0_OSTLU|nr:predicted protein [Ostreococcus lucimarinus CCE9901]ABO98622.1 predicted protein [Ostreococcus lucimarinus CCE9901]|eukprot:XP_001420329.1 predicted protein [Ostreococcus lucimarinus CCE9901]